MRTPFVVAALLALTACYPEPRPLSQEASLSTRCGLILPYGDEGDLQRLQRQEDITLAQLSAVKTNVPWTQDMTCGLLEGTTVRIEPLLDGGIWSDDQFFELKRGGYDRGRYFAPYEAVVTTYNWSNPEFSWQLVRVITRGAGGSAELFDLTADALATSTKLGREEPGTGSVPLQEEPAR